MLKSLFNAANHEISERVLRSGNYLDKINNIEDQAKGGGNRFVFRFLATPQRWQFDDTQGISSGLFWFALHTVKHIGNQLLIILT